MHTPLSRQALFAGSGEMGDRIARHDWAATSLGAIEQWPEALVNAVSLMLPASAEIVLFWGPDYIALYNNAYAPTIGVKHPGALGEPAAEWWAELWDDLEPLLAHVRDTGETYAAKDRAFYLERGGAGEETYFDISYSPVRLSDGDVGGVLCIVNETTDRVRASRALAEDRARLAEMFDQAPSFMAVVRGPTHVIELANRSYLRLIGRDQSAIGLRLAEVVPEIAEQGYVDLLDTVLASGQPHRADGARVLLQRGAGGAYDERYIDFVFQPIRDAAGNITGVFVEGNDVTERLVAERRLVLSEDSLRIATDAAEIGIWDCDIPANTMTWTDRTRAAFGISPGVPVSLDDFYAGLHPDDLEATREAFVAAIDPARRARYDVEYRTIGAEDGTVRWVAAKGRGIFDGDVCVRAVGTTLDITERKALAARVREGEERFRVMADTAPALIWMTDDDGDLVFANAWFEMLFGDPAQTMLGRGWTRVLRFEDNEPFRAEYRRAFDAREAWSTDMRVADRNDDIRWMHAEARPRFVAGSFAGYIGCAVDVSEAHRAAEELERAIATRTHELADANAELTRQIGERERVEATLNQMQRLEAVGQLTSGVAHDFNNLLTVILGNVGMLERGAAAHDLDAKARRRLEHVRTAAERGAALTAQLLAFARRTRLAATAVDLNQTVVGMRDLMQSSLGGGITIETSLGDALWPALVDATQIELIILNLAINARDAMPGGGRLLIATDNVTRGDPQRPEEPAAGEYVMVSVADEGSGMTPEVAARAFEPFFTTKDVGKGSGLGLAQVFGFAKQSGGGVRVDTAEGEGTTVRVYLPQATAAAPEAAAPPAVDEDTGPASGAVILVLDDDEAVRNVTADGLREVGYRVIEAASGAAALEALAMESYVDLVVADFAMPEMNGAEFAERALALYPRLPILFVTGYADLAALSAIPRERVIAKPFSQNEIASHVRRALEPRPH